MMKEYMLDPDTENEMYDFCDLADGV